MNQTNGLTELSYSNCKRILNLLKKGEATCSPEEKLDYGIAITTIDNLRQRAMMSDVDAAFRLFKEDYINKEQMVAFVNSIEELKGTKLEESLLSM